MCEPPDRLEVTHPIHDVVFMVGGPSLTVPIDIFAIEPGLCEKILDVTVEPLPGGQQPITRTF